MYGDSYKPENQRHYEQMELFFSKCQTRDDLREATMLFVFDLSVPRQDIHVAHKRACLKKGWE
jgi:hypothetical protein